MSVMRNTPTHGVMPSSKEEGPKDKPPQWYGGMNYTRIPKGSDLGGRNNSGPSGWKLDKRRSGRNK